MRSFTVARIWNIPIRVNTSLIVFLPILAWLIGAGGQIEVYGAFIQQLSGTPLDIEVLRAGWNPWIIGVVAAVSLFVSVTLHELGHSWVALRYGIEIESITLWLLGGIASLKSLPREWNREFWIAIAGPITSVLIGVVCYVGLLVTPQSLPIVQFLVGWLAITNVVLAGFNLLPAFPMDGGRILRSLLARSRPYASATRIAGRIGVIFAIVFAVVGVVSFNIILVLLALFIYAAATTESKSVLLDELLEGFTVGDIMTRSPGTISADATVSELGDRMLQERRTVFPVTDETGAVVGLVSLSDLRRARKSDRSVTVREILRDVPRLEVTADAFETLALMGSSRLDAVLVEDEGEVVGVLSESDYAHALTVRRGAGSGSGPGITW